jgi:Asp-tRNA(Asn)/Glu-tRNA(Gln) amidotransferase C subunit
MSKEMTLDVLSSIKGAKPSEAVDSLFDVIKKAQSSTEFNLRDAILENAVLLNDLREDIVIESTELERTIIKQNFPSEKNGYLMVAKVIED